MRFSTKASTLALSIVTFISAATAVAQSAIADSRPRLVVMSFESGTVSAKVKDRNGYSSVLAAMRGDYNNEHYDPSDLGAGIADMLVEKLLNTGEFRLLERKQVEAAVREQMISLGTNPAAAIPSDAAVAKRASMIGARYVLTGSVTKFGFEEHQVGGLMATIATAGMLSVKRHKTEVTLTARVIDITTGEIVASFDGDGVSNKGGGVIVFGMNTHGLAGGGAENRKFQETAIGEATERAVQSLVEKLEARKAALAPR
jgi:curli biogenesis system outer membrane secretion channel CsgG